MDACRRIVTVGTPISEIASSCADCGHTLVVHAGAHNKGLDHCVLCDLTSLSDTMLDRVSDTP